ncbi:MAG: nicotinamide mononucleotide deamidase-related protein [Desulfurococcales archaeon]|nr:nicotinamide mononucleotide deamidase-related protein [Desulfurococcales archaeon]
MAEKNTNAWIITVGNEILIGRIVNTNAAWLGEKLTFLGFRVERVITVPDSLEDIEEEVGRGIARARIVITTGGLGPTYDDMTLEGVARATGRRLVLNEEAYRMVREFYAKAGYELTKEREKMAMLPEGAEAIPNPVGAAPGSLLDLGDTLVISLPGVPAEMKAMFEQYVEPKLREIAPHKAVVDCGFIVKGVPESGLAPWIKKASRLEESIYLKSHPKGHETMGPVLEIRVLASGKTRKEAMAKARRVLEYVAEKARGLGGETGEINCKGEDQADK